MARKGKQKQFGKPKAQKAVGNHAHVSDLQKIQDAIDKSDLTTAYQLADAFTQQHATSPHGWEMLANVQAQQQNLKNACASMQKAIELAKGDHPLSELKLAQYELFGGDAHQCIKRLTGLSERIPSEKRVWVWLSRAYHVIGLNKEALVANEKAYELDRRYPDTLVWRSRILDQLKRHSESYEASAMLKKLKPTLVGVSNHLASLSLREGDYEAAEQHFREELAIGKNGAAAYNSFIAKHYNPAYSAEELSELAKQFESEYVNESNVVRASTESRQSKRIRIGLLSGSFRTHPVGQMILPALRALDKNEVELFFYTTNQIVDKLTLEIQKVADSWASVVELSDEQLNQKIRNDKVDILIDMNGGGEGSKFLALAKEPAPLMVKWVGILINTTGLKCFDYLLSDSIETPKNVDHLYTEKLIRLPDDYICYHLPDYVPDVTGLPALKNGFITFGCLNNPAKLSRELIKEWSTLMHEVPSSKLLLRGIQFEGEVFCQRTIARFAEFNIGAERLLLEGPAKHKEFLETYQRIDIALDTWPYSGGLTTCEALAMGVPVVTCVGPTFAGRHSATHLANAGLPELVTDNWDDFRKRVKELTADLPSLAVIRAALRTILKESPVCDGARFAQNFTKALRGIWQRHCEGKAPEALTFNKEGEAWFADNSVPIELVEVEIRPESQKTLLDWEFEEPITVVDNGALFARQSNFSTWLATGSFAVISFDPGSLLTQQANKFKELGEWHHYPHASLGDGNNATLYATLEPELTGTLEPILMERDKKASPLSVLSELPISTVALNSIEGMPRIDVLVIDSLNDARSILENGDKYWGNMLLLHVELAFQETHKQQATLEDLQRWASCNEFRFYTLFKMKYRKAGEGDFISKNEGSELWSAEALFVPNSTRLKKMSDEQCMKLAFILENCYGMSDISERVSQFVHQGIRSFKELKHLDVEEKNYLSERVERNEKVIVHVFFNNMHAQPLINVLKDDGEFEGYSQRMFVSKSRSIPNYDVNISSAPNAIYFDEKNDLDSLVAECLSEDVVGVFLHGLFFDWQKVLVDRIAAKKKTVWVMWGGDLYNPIKKGMPLYSTVEKLSGVATWWDGDYEVFVSIYGDKPRVPFRYFGGSEYVNITSAKEKEKIIFVGNSGDPQNQHAEILVMLSKKEDISDYSLVIPLGYNAPVGYGDMLAVKAKQLGLEENVTFIKEKIASDKYFEWLSRAEMLILAHNRQQGGANAFAATLYGVKLVMREYIFIHKEKKVKNPIWRQLETVVGNSVFSYEDFCSQKSVNAVSFSIGYDLSNKRKLLKDYLSKGEVVRSILAGFKLVDENMSISRELLLRKNVP